MITVHAIPVLTDNYVWVLERDTRCVVVDPGEAAPVQRWIKSRGLSLEAILLTHHHGDHVAGVIAIANADIDVFSSTPDLRRIPGVTRGVSDGSTIEVLGATFRVIATPGHTLGAVCYYGEGMAFTGDTLFAAGCGRLFEGTADQLYRSLRRLVELLPEPTQIYCGHEYTEKNLDFAAGVEPNNEDIKKRIADVKELRRHGKPTLPSTMALEMATNPFLRATDVEMFTELRKVRDEF
jgi:hydroxyacylglutathione hydrolase